MQTCPSSWKEEDNLEPFLWSQVLRIVSKKPFFILAVSFLHSVFCRNVQTPSPSYTVWQTGLMSLLKSECLFDYKVKKPLTVTMVYSLNKLLNNFSCLCAWHFHHSDTWGNGLTSSTMWGDVTLLWKSSSFSRTGLVTPNYTVLSGWRAADNKSICIKTNDQ